MKFSTRLGLYLIAITITVTVSVSYLFYSVTKKSLENEIRKRTVENTYHLMNKIEKYMFERVQDSRIIASSLPFKEEPIDIKKTAGRLIDYRDEWKCYSSISFYNADGVKVIDTSGLGIGTNQKNEPFFKEAFEKGTSEGTWIAEDVSEKMPVIYFSCVVKGKKENLIGVVVGRVPLYRVHEILYEPGGGHDEVSGDAFGIDLIDSKKRILYSNRKSVRILEQKYQFEDELKKINAGANFDYIYPHENLGESGRHFNAFVSELGYLSYKGNGWILITWQPEKYLSEPLNTLKARLAVLSVLFMVLAAIIVLVLKKELLKRLSVISETVYKIRDGDLNINIEHESRDEIGRLERDLGTMAAELKASNEKIENYSRELENKVKERTRQLEAVVRELKDARDATLSILEDTNASKNALEETNAKLKSAQEDLKEFSRGLEENVRKRTRELALLYDISNAISYTLDYDKLLKLVMDSLHKAVEYDYFGAVLILDSSVNLYLRPAYSHASKFNGEMKNKLIDSVRVMTEKSFDESNLRTIVLSVTGKDEGGDGSGYDELKTFVNIPIVVHGKIFGLVNVASCQDGAFSEENVRLIHTVINLTSSAMERLQSVISAEKSKMESMIESMIEGVVMTDVKGTVLVINSRAKELLSLNEEDGLSECFNSKIKENEISDIFAECIRKRVPMGREIIVKGARNTVVRWDVSPAIDAFGEIQGITSIVRDITKEKEIEQMKSDFVSTVSHELRTPLTPIRESISMTLDGVLGAVTDKQKKYMKMSLEDIDRLSRIIDDLLDISKIESGKTELKKDYIDMSVLVETVKNSFMSIAGAKGIELKTNLKGGDYEVYVDRDKMVQVLTNLINNSLKFTVKGSITISVEEKAGEVVCSVSDTGVGISKTDLGKVFGKFQQFERVDGPGEKGTGLGLSITKGIVELHGGKIWVESTLGEGTSFIFSLPKNNQDWPLYNVLNSKITKAKQNRTSFAVFVYRIDNYHDLIEKHGEGKVYEMHQKVSSGLESVSAVRCEVSCERTDNRFVIIQDMEEKNILETWNMYRKFIKKTIYDFDANIQVRLSFGKVFCPDYGANSAELLRKVHEDMSSEIELRKEKTIMIADDEENVRKVLIRKLELLGYTKFINAQDGEDALSKIENGNPDLLILDMKMPKMGGYEVIGRLKENIRTRDIPILVITAYHVDMDDLKNKAIPMIQKPFEDKDLNRWVDYLI